MWLPFLAVACSNQVLLDNVVLTELICAVHLERSRQYVASVFGIPLVERIHGIL